MRTAATLAIIASLTGCAATQAYVAQHPETATIIQIAGAVERCLDTAAASLIDHDDLETLLGNTAICLGQQFAGQALADAKIEAGRQLSIRASLRLRTLRAGPEVVKPLSFIKSADPALSMAAVYPQPEPHIRVPLAHLGTYSAD